MLTHLGYALRAEKTFARQVQGLGFGLGYALRALKKIVRKRFWVWGLLTCLRYAFHAIKTSGRKGFRKGGAWGRANGRRKFLQGCDTFSHHRHILKGKTRGRGPRKHQKTFLDALET